MEAAITLGVLWFIGVMFTIGLDPHNPKGFWWLYLFLSLFFWPYRLGTIIKAMFSDKCLKCPKNK